MFISNRVSKQFIIILCLKIDLTRQYILRLQKEKHRIDEKPKWKVKQEKWMKFSIPKKTTMRRKKKSVSKDAA